MRVYIAGPLESGPDPAANVRRALDAATALLDAGLVPYVPHLTWFWNESHPRPRETWLALDREWLSTCDAVLRLPGESPGSELEELWARELGLPVFPSLGELLTWAEVPLQECRPPTEAR